MKSLRLIVPALAFSLGLAGAARAELACADLAAHAPDKVTVLSVQEVAPAALSPVEGGGATTPAFCRVRAEIRPVAGSRIGMELWLPQSGWNGKFEMVGNGGYGSSLDYPAMAGLLASGYAAAGTDTGHQGDDPDFALGHPEAIVDWGYRAVHLTAVEAKRLTTIRYAALPSHSYFAGCSTGGHQAMMEAQRFPDDFDGIIAGASGGDRTHLNAGFLWQFLRNHRTDDPATLLPATKLPMITQAALAACRGDNGGRAGGLASDGWLDDPQVCRFRPATLQCTGDEDGPDCLTKVQIVALHAMYDGARNPRTGRRVANGYPMGSESSGGPPSLPGWSLYWADPRHPDQPARANFWRLWAGFGPNWSPWRFDFDRDMAATDSRLAATINATNPDLDGFQRRGGKLIAYHGLADPVVPVADSTDYRSAVLARVQSKTKVLGRQAQQTVDAFYRLFLAPGMGHCGGGPGLNKVETQSALEAWVEHGVAPQALLARHEARPAEAQPINFSRPVCRYPAYAVYQRGGDPTKAQSFFCRSD